MTWDFSKLPNGVQQIQSYLAANQIPRAVRDSFPGTQVAISTDTTLALYAIVGRYFRLLGVVTPKTQMSVVTDPYDTRPTEIVYTGRLIDAYRAVIRVTGPGGGIVRRTGTHAISYDGFGTLILPARQYTDVARLTTTGATTDSLVVNAVTTVTRMATRRTTYQVFSSDTVLLEIVEVQTTVTRNGQQIGQPTTATTVIHYGNANPNSVDEEATRFATVVPNPSNGSALRIQAFSKDLQSLHVFDVAGLRVEGITWERRGDNDLAVTLPGLSSGAYVVVLESAGGSTRVLPFTVLR